MNILTIIWATTGIPLPYSLRTDDGIALVLLGCFVLSSYALAHSRKLLFQLGKDFLSGRERVTLFATSTAGDVRYLLLLLLQTCVLASICLFNHWQQVQPELLAHIPPLPLLGIYMAGALLYLLLKWGIYSLSGWIFFNKGVVSSWMVSYLTLLYYCGFVLFPFVLLMVYFNLSLQETTIIGLILLLFAKILMFYKWLKLFCNNLYGSSLLILYFCALEIIPFFLAYQGMIQLNHFLIIKF